MIQIDMKMPSRCYYCPFAKDKKTNDYGSFCECVALGNHETINLLEHSRHSNCPLIEQQPYEDVISRQAVLEYIEGSEAELGHSSENELVCQDIKDFPSVTPQPKAVLYSGDGYADGYMVYDMAECPNCGYEYEEGDKDWKLPFCPNCGQALVW